MPDKAREMERLIPYALELQPIVPDYAPETWERLRPWTINYMKRVGLRVPKGLLSLPLP